MSPSWNDDSELFDLIRRELYTPVIGDILDGLGYDRQFLPQVIRPIAPQMTLVGRAMPVLQAQVRGQQEKPFGLMTEALDDLKAGEIYIAGGRFTNCANWGELMTAAARCRGALGAVVDGFHRDTPAVLAQEFPVFSHGCYAQDSSLRMRVVDFRCDIVIGQVSVRPGDLVVGDIDGVLIVPQGLVVQVISDALVKARGEKTVRCEIENGMSTTEAFARYGIL